MNVNIFIIRVLKLTFMKYYRIPVAFLVIIVFLLVPVSAGIGQVVAGVPPGAAQITAGAPVFIGESNLDVSLALHGYPMIAWWPPGADMSTNPAVTVAVPDQTHVTIDLNDFSGHLGTWYSYGQQPYFPVFTVVQPQIDLKVWDIDHNMDVTGQSVPLTTNITYRIDTNLWQALNYTYRPSINPSSSFFTVTLTSPRGALIPQIYTGNIGAQNTRILPFDSNPVITSTPYYGMNLPYWNRNARSTDGSIIYPTGTYTFSVSQNLNGMSAVYGTNASMNTIGILTSGDKTVTFLPATVPTTLTSVAVVTTIAQSMPTPAQATQPVPTNLTTTVVPVKTTYSPLPAETAVIGGLLAAGVIIFVRRHR
jgi:hypothetical protein